MERLVQVDTLENVEYVDETCYQNWNVVLNCYMVNTTYFYYSVPVCCKYR